MHTHPEGVLNHFCPNSEPPALGHCLDRVGDEIDQNSPQEYGIDLDHRNSVLITDAGATESYAFSEQAEEARKVFVEQRS